MYLRTLPTFILAIGVAIAGLFIGRTLLVAKKYDRTVTVKGLAERQVNADVAIWPMTITVTSEGLSQLQGQITDHTMLVKKFLRESGFDELEMSLSFPNIRDNRLQGYDQATMLNKPRYVASIDVTIRTSDIDKLHRAMHQMPEVVGSGIMISSKNTWEPIQYLYTQLNSIKPGMIEEATKNAREVAVKFAADSGSEVGKIREARQGVFSISNRDINTAYIKNVRIVTTIEYLLKD